MTLFTAMLIGALSAATAWLLSENRRAAALAERDNIGELVGAELGAQYAERIAIGETVLEATRRRAFMRQFKPDGFDQITAMQFTLAGTTYTVTITEADAEVEAEP